MLHCTRGISVKFQNNSILVRAKCSGHLVFFNDGYFFFSKVKYTTLFPVDVKTTALEFSTVSGTSTYGGRKF